MTKKEKIKALLEEYFGAGRTPTEIANELDLPHSGYVARDLKALVAEGWAYRDVVKPGTILYGKKQNVNAA